MANIKITDLTAYTDPASTDVLPIVDVTNDETKKVSIADLMENAGAGTEALPGIAFDGDPNTGIYRPDADQIAISTAGEQRLLISDTGRVGVGTASPSETLEVVGNAVLDATDATLKIKAGTVGTKGALQFTFNTDSTDYGALDLDYDARTSTGLRLFSRYPLTLETSASSLPIVFIQGPSNESARLDNAGRFLLGTNVNTPGGGGFYAQTAGTSQAEASILQIGYIDAVGGPIHRFIHDKAATVGGTNTSVAEDDKLGELQFLGADGTGYVQSAQIIAEVDGTPGTDTMPGRLVFSTTTTNSPTARMTIDSSGYIGINTSEPTRLLTVNAGTQPQVALSINDTEKLRIQSLGAINYIDNIDQDLVFRGGSAGTTNLGAFTNAGNFGIGNTSPAQLLDVNGDALINGLTIGKGAGSLGGNTAIGEAVLGNATTGGIGNVGVGYLSLQDLTTGSDNTALGNRAGANITEATANVFVGRSAGLLTTTGNSNTAIGYLTLGDNVGGQSNVAVGQRALAENVAGNNGIAIGVNSQRYANNKAIAYTNSNISIGHQSLMGSTTAADNTGANNTCMGYVSMQNNTTGYNNVAIGYSTLFDNTSGVSNIAIGMRVLENNTTGNNMVAIGYDALKNNVAGVAGVAIGYNSQVYVNNTATTFTNTNTSVGYQAHRGSTTPADNTGLSNTAVGYLAMLQVSSGGGNTAIGSDAGGDITTGSRNTFIGTSSGRFITTATDNTAIGYLAFDNASVVSNSTAIGYESQRYAHNTTTAKDGNNTSVGYRALRGSTAAANNTGISNTAVGFAALQVNTSGDANVAIGGSTLVLNTTGNRNTAVGSNALMRNTTGTDNSALGNGAGRFEQDGSDDANFTNCTYLGYDTRASGDDQVQLGNSATTTYAYGSVQDRSDERDKTDIRDTVIGLDFINTLRPVDFRWDMRDDYFDTEVYEEEETETVEVPNPAYIEDGDEPQYIEETRTKMVTKDRLVPVTKDGSRKRNRFHHGLIAQEVKAAADAAGVDFAGYQDHSVSGGKDVLTLGYSELIAPLIKAVQELSAENATLKARLDALEGV